MSQTPQQQAQRLHELHLAATKLAEELGLTFLEIRAKGVPNGPTGWDLELGTTTPQGDPFRTWVNADDPSVIRDTLIRIFNRRNPS
jgi:hypothetical protein